MGRAAQVELCVVVVRVGSYSLAPTSFATPRSLLPAIPEEATEDMNLRRISNVLMAVRTGAGGTTTHQPASSRIACIAGASDRC